MSKAEHRSRSQDQDSSASASGSGQEGDELHMLDERSDEIEENIEEAVDAAEDIIGDLKSYNKGVLTDIAHRAMGNGYDDFYEFIDDSRVKLEEELKAVQSSLERDIKKFKEDVRVFSGSFRQYLAHEKKNGNSAVEDYMEIGGSTKFQNRFVAGNGWTPYGMDAEVSAAERFFVKKTYYYDQIMRCLEQDLKMIDKKLRSAEERLQLGEDPKQVAKDLYSFGGRFFGMKDPHNLHKMRMKIRDIEDMSLSDYA
ncbi:hypothetical protein ACK3SF_04220 [Candidatus Nanosalina sp. VS9-1]|uniref:hypothetical protein n=1 Tax=Candidatus Nanosalina sp. VS9-1 TaxID=3388566 RepID=UPI0039DFA57E